MDNVRWVDATFSTAAGSGSPAAHTPLCLFTEMEPDEHFTTLGYPVHVFPGNFMIPSLLSAASKVGNCACPFYVPPTPQIWNYTDTDNRKGQRRSRICPFKSTGKGIGRIKSGQV